MIQQNKESTLIHFIQDDCSIYIEVWSNNHTVVNVFKDKKQILNTFGTISKCLKAVNKLLEEIKNEETLGDSD